MEMPSMAHLAQHFMRETNGELVMVREASRLGLDAASKLLLDTAKSYFGHYQKGTGPFADWPELAQFTKEDRLKKGFTENDPLLRSGKLRDSMVRDVEDFAATVGSTDEVMLWQELGTTRMPPRPVLGIALQRCWPQIKAMMDNAAASGFSGTKQITKPGYDL